MSDLFEVADPRFKSLFNGSARLEHLGTGYRWAEGPAWFAAGRYLVWSDIPNDRMMRWDETDGTISVFRQPAGNTNGHTVDREGRLVSCEHGGRRVSRTEHDGTITTIAERYQGKRLNSPNDAVVKSDGSIWFTDPSYGIDSDYEGNKAESEIGSCNVYRVDPADGEITAVITDMKRPNGLAFSLDEKLLYVADTGATHDPKMVGQIKSYQVKGDKCTGGKVLIKAKAGDGLYDGFRLDVDGNIWSSAADGVHCYADDGKLLGKVKVPEGVANVAWGGIKRNMLFICATTSLYAVRLKTSGAKTV